MINKAIILSLAAVFMMTLWDVFSNYAVDALNANPAFYSSFSLFVAAFTLIIIAGPGRLGFETLRSPKTWMYAVFQIFMGVFETYSYTVVTATEFNLITRIQVILSILVAFLVLGRKPSKHDMIGSGVILLAVWIMVSTLSPETRGIAVAYIGLASLFFVFRGIAAETHEQSNEAKSIKEECRVTGFILLVTSFTFMFFYAVIGYIADNTLIGQIEGAPSISYFINPQALFAAFFCGMVLISLAKYLYFSAIKHVKTENYTMIATLAGVLAFAMEWGGSKFIPGMNATSLNMWDLIGGAIAIAGVMYIFYMRQKSQRS